MVTGRETLYEKNGEEVGYGWHRKEINEGKLWRLTNGCRTSKELLY